MFASRVPVLLVLTACSLAALRCEPAHAQWWSRAPADFEECADLAEQSPSKEEKTAALAQCNAKFAGRRKPGGGYTYYDFMQNRIFDIAGPNPTPEEQKYIDQQYSLYLEKRGRDNVATAFMTRPQPQNLQQASLRDVPVRAAIEPERVPLPIQRPSRPPSADARARVKVVPCVKEPGKDSLSCSFQMLSEKLSDLKRFLTGQTPPPAPASKAKKG
ncbi:MULTISPECIES: hypothetical protein [unclassified Bradyrhizobium]|uniref:hypothetical protein n=1 Tax=unclassified Bradyrhizobium TaxID=2631580 RepID=UPI0028E7C8FE|nr:MULTISPECIES: hypothetical protein [unclassified Bradyrhizobium]